MFKIMKSVLLAAGILYGASAQAAFYTYTFDLQASGSRTIFTPGDPTRVTNVGLQGATITMGLDFDEGRQVAFGTDGDNSFTLYAESFGLRFVISPLSPIMNLAISGRGTACYTATPPLAIPTSSVAVTGNCASSYDITSSRGQYRETFTGSVTGLTVTRQDTGTNVLSIAGIVPEPATWAMMLAGFGLVGFAMRRQRAKGSFA